MRVSYKWLQEYVEIPVSVEELADRLTLAGLTVEAIHKPGEGIERVYTGRIEKIEAHPNADRLVICYLTLGSGEALQIVTGAPNVAVGQVVAVAVEGARLAGGTVIKKARFRGVESRGMLCSGAELGLDPKTLPSDQAHGILVLPPDTPLGVDVKPLVGLDDAILELDLTPNRGDCLSMIGVAREVAALFGKPLQMPDVSLTELPENIESMAEVHIEDPDLCSRYVARVFVNIRIGPSPLWMQERLRAAGLRPINNVVDITNYVMIELGQPLHAFDYDRVREGKIIVRRARPGETMVSLDGVERVLDDEMLVIADPAGPVGLAGVMGGLESEITEETRRVLLESARFNPVNIRRTSRKLGLRSEASNRFEKGVDPAGCLRAADRAGRLLQLIGAGEVVGGVIDNYPVPVTEKTIMLRHERVKRVLGVDIPAAGVKNILESLQFRVKEGKGDSYLVTVPTYRPDVSIEEDLIEEVARLYGFNRIPATLPTGVTTVGMRSKKQVFEKKVAGVLTACGFSEVITYSFISPGAFDLINLPPDSSLRDGVYIQNPLSEEQSVMRTTLLPGLLEVLRRNYNRQVKSGAVFEMGKVFYPRKENLLPEERLKVAAAAIGESKAGWNVPSRPLDFYYLKGVLETLLDTLKTGGVFFEPETRNPSFHPGRTARVMAGDVCLGTVGELHPDVMERLDLSERITAFELDLELLFEASGTPVKYRPLPRYPGVERDIAVVVESGVLVRDVVDLIRKAGGDLLRSVELFDVYTGPQVKEGYRSLAFALYFQAEDRTLTDGEVNELMEKISGILAQKVGAELRR